MPLLTDIECSALAEAILQLPQVQSLERREDIIARLDPSIRDQILYRADTRSHIDQIVSTCAEYPHGIASLIAALRPFYRGMETFEEKIQPLEDAGNNDAALHTAFNPAQAQITRLQKRLQDLDELIQDLQTHVDLVSEPQRRRLFAHQLTEANRTYETVHAEYERLTSRREASQNFTVPGSLLNEIRDRLNTLAVQQQILVVVMVRLSETQQKNTQAILVALEQDRLSESDITQSLSQLRTELAALTQSGQLAHTPLAEAVKQSVELFDDPKLEAKHKLKVGIPIIPGILSYETELALGTSLGLSALWERLVARLHTRP